MKKQEKPAIYDRPSWDEYFMDMAYNCATRSSCKHLHTGAVLVKDKRIIGTGYNGASPNIENCLSKGCRKDEVNISFDDKGKSVCRGTHAEMNALGQIGRERASGTTIYSVYFPCSACAKAIVGNDISEVVYSLMYEEADSLTKETFAEAGIKLRHLNINIEKQNNRRLAIKAQQNKT